MQLLLLLLICRTLPTITSSSDLTTTPPVRITTPTTTQTTTKVRCWDGVPPTPEELEDAAVHCAKAYNEAMVRVVMG